MRIAGKKVKAEQKKAACLTGSLARMLLAFVLCMTMLSFNTILAGRHEKKLEAIRMSLAELEQKKGALLAQKERMYEEIASRNDPAWIEVVLMKKLGFVPKGQKKVLFEGSE